MATITQPPQNSAISYREQARACCAKRKELMETAGHHEKRSQYQLARDYYELAEIEKLEFERLNHLAANEIMAQNSQEMGDPAMLDLHSLQVMEAVAILDVFLDEHICNLQENYVCIATVKIITGRGINSRGKARIKPAVHSRLRVRGLYYEELNPGMVGVTICANSKFSTQVPSK